MRTIGSLQVVTFAHPQGCRGYLLADQKSKEALAIDVHLDFVHDFAERVKTEGWYLRYVVDTHTHADHPSGAQDIAKQFNSIRISHENAHHAGVTFHPADGEKIKIGDLIITFRHAPGHTPDHLVLIADGALFSGDSLFIGGVARADFLGGDAGLLFDSIHYFLSDLPGNTILFPGHDYNNQIERTLDKEKNENPWLKIRDRDEFIRNLTANPPPKPANMDNLLRFNREGIKIPEKISAEKAVRFVAEGGASSVIDVRTPIEFENEHIPGSRLIPVNQIDKRVDYVRAVPIPRLLLCNSGNRAGMAKKALERFYVAGLSVIEGGILAYERAGGTVIKGKERFSIEQQVRIAAGSLSLLGVLMGFFIHPVFLILSGFISAGLIFSGITEWCGIAVLLGKMPWNQIKEPEIVSSSGGTCAAAVPSAEEDNQ